jgi:hypothetical protein
MKLRRLLKKERERWNEEDTTRYERGVKQRYRKPQKKESNRKLINKNFKSNKNTVESHSSILEQLEDRLSGLENKIHIKEKTEELDKTQELWNTRTQWKTIKRPTCELWASKEKSCKPKEYTMY